MVKNLWSGKRGPMILTGVVAFIFVAKVVLWLVSARGESIAVFSSVGRFRSYEEVTYYAGTASVEGEPVSAIAREAWIGNWTRGRVSIVHVNKPQPVGELLKNMPGFDEWRRHIDTNELADTVICVLDPNVVHHPRGATMKFLGEFSYHIGPK